jgi:hypothetical protein
MKFLHFVPRLSKNESKSFSSAGGACTGAAVAAVEGAGGGCGGCDPAGALNSSLKARSMSFTGAAAAGTAAGAWAGA